MSGDPKNRPVAKSDGPAPDLRRERDEFLQTFKGSRLTEEFIKEHQSLQQRLLELEDENALLRAQVEADDAVRELLTKIRSLESEKSELLSRYRQAEEATSRFSERFHEFEAEFANLANLFVASNQLHSSLSPRGVTRRIKEVLAQLVGAEAYCMYLGDDMGEQLVPVASEGVPAAQLTSVRVKGSRIGEVFRSGAAFVNEEDDSSRGDVHNPSAVVPLSIDDRTVGVIAIFSTLAQKTRFEATDFELFKLLGQHAAAALVSASLFHQAERKLPGLEAFIDLSV